MLILFLLGAVVVGRPLQGSDDTVGEENPSQGPQNQFQTIALDPQIRQILGDGSGGGIGGVRAKALAQLEFEIEGLDDVCGLNDAQREKLALAARLEAARSVDLFEVFQRRYEGRVVDLQTREGQEEWQRFHQEINQIQRSTGRSGALRHLPGRIVGSVLDGRQREAWEVEAALRGAAQWRRCVDAGLAHLESFVGMTDRQHEAVVGLLMEDPPRLDMAKAREMFGDHNPFLCWYGLSRVDRDRLEKVFDARQWERVANVVRQGEQWKPQIDSMKVREE